MDTWAATTICRFLHWCPWNEITLWWIFQLPNDSTRIADENSLLITDLVVELDDGSLADVEIQKIGYNFPGQRSACYSADMLLRQYKRIRSLKKKKFHYRDIKDVYIIVLFEHSTSEFHNFPDDYLHYFSQRSNTGLELELLQKFVFVALDIFQEIQHNKIINSKLDAWLLFLTSDNPKDIRSFRRCMNRHTQCAGIWRKLWDFFQKSFEF